VTPVCSAPRDTVAAPAEHAQTSSTPERAGPESEAVEPYTRLQYEQDFASLVRDHGAMIARISASYESSAILAQELTQEILLAVWQALPSFRGKSSIRTFVARIAHNRAVTHVARHAAQPKSMELSEDIVAPEPLPEQRVIESERRERLMQAVRLLPLQFRQPVTLTLEGFTPAEIADVLGVSANVVAIRLTRAKALLRARLQS
jgi:RNA polymerase sigma factor (sigma-70 family)